MRVSSFIFLGVIAAPIAALVEGEFNAPKGNSARCAEVVAPSMCASENEMCSCAGTVLYGKNITRPWVKTIGPGHCEDWRYAGSGTQTGSYGAATTREDCMAQCLDILPSSTSFYLSPTNGCGCSATTQGRCTLTSSHPYTAYEIIQENTIDVLTAKEKVSTSDTTSCSSAAMGGDPAPGHTKACFCQHFPGGSLNCTAVPSPIQNNKINRGRGRVHECLDGQISGNGFFMLWTEPKVIGLCLDWESIITVQFYMNCATMGSDEFLCNKQIGGHPNYADKNMGFLVGKRVHCRRGPNWEQNGAYKCDTFKVGICIQDVGFDFSEASNVHNHNLATETQSWVDAAVAVLKTSSTGGVPAANQCQTSSTPALYQSINSKTLVEHAIAIA